MTEPQSTSNHPDRRKLPFAIRPPQVVILLTFSFMLAVSWRRWVSIIADSGRELDLPLRLWQGEWLYRDVHYLYTPLAPYLNAKLYQLFGARLETLQFSGLICSLLIAWLSYRIARHLLPPAESSLAVCTIIIFCIFKPGGNLISPYSYSALYGMVLALACLLACLHSQRTANPRWLALAGLLGTGALLAKQEFAIVAAAALGAAIWQIHQTRRMTLLKAVMPVALTSLPVLGLALGALLERYEMTMLINDCHLLFTNLPASLRFYNAQRTGLNAPRAGLAQMLGGASVAVTVASLIIWLSLNQASVLKRRVAMTGFVALGCALVILFFARGQWDGSPLRALPLFLLATLWLTRPRAQQLPTDAQTDTTMQGALFILAAYSFAALLRVLLRVPSGGAFGSFFLPTSLILLVYALLHSLPNAVTRWANNAAAGQRARRYGWGLLVLALVSTSIVFGLRYRRTYTHLIATPRGTFYAPGQAGAAYAEALDFIRANSQPADQLAVLPEGSDLAFLSERATPLRHQILIPGLMSAADEQRAIAQLAHLRFVLIVNRPMREFGAVAFGQDFYPALGKAIEEKFQLVKIFGTTSLGQPDKNVPTSNTEAQRDLAIGAPEFFIKLYAHR